MVTLVSFVVAFAITCFGSSKQSPAPAVNAVASRHPGVVITAALRRTETYRDARRALLGKRYALAQTAGVACNANLLAALRGERPAETTGEDNLKTLELVFGAYESAASGATLNLA